MSALDDDALKAMLDDARRALAEANYRSRDTSFEAWKITQSASPLSSPARTWAVSQGERAIAGFIRRAAKDEVLAVYDRFISYAPVKHEPKRFAALRTTPVTLSEDEKTVEACQASIDNHEVMALLEKHGAVLDLTAHDDPVIAAGSWDVRSETMCRVGRSWPTKVGIAASLNHQAQPRLLEHPVLRTLAGLPPVRPPSDQASGPSSSSLQSDPKVSASKRPTQDGPSEWRSQSALASDLPTIEACDATPPEEASEPRVVKGTGTSLDPDQEAACCIAVDRMDVHAMLIDGPPGTGKSQTIIEIVRRTRGRDRKIAVTSTEGSALDVARRRLAAHGIAENADLFIGSSHELFQRRPRHADTHNNDDQDFDFDLAVIDEASRMPIEIALLVAIHARRLVIIGDDKQTRPSNNQRTILDVAKEQRLLQVTLRYHYRSRERSLISISNILAYGLALRTVPTPDCAPGDGTKMITLPDARGEMTGRGSINRQEADAIIRWLTTTGFAHQRSIGIVTATYLQRDLITAMIKDQSLSKKKVLKDQNEPLFVRQIDEVQGEERDTILVSTVFEGRRKGKLGIFENEGVIEKINVMMSRSRFETRLYTSLNFDDLPVKEWRRGHIALRAMMDVVRTTAHAETRRATMSEVQNLAQRLALNVDNLGVVNGLKRPGSFRYDLGLVVTDDQRCATEWAAIVRQLEIIGWQILVVPHIRLQTNFEAVCAEVKSFFDRPRHR